MQTIFVAGAEGFAGAQLTSQLRQHGYRVVAGVRNRARKLAYERQHGQAIVCDVADAINVARAIASAKPDGIVQLAGYSHAYQAVDEPLDAYQSIVSAWANILDAARRIVPRARVLLISACDVYGNACAQGQPASESTPAQPVSTFGSLKLAAESIAHTFFEKYHLNLTIARPFHYTGPGHPDSFFYGAMARRITQWDRAADGDELVLPDFHCRRDVLHIADVIDAYERLLVDGQPNETYNVCSGEARTCGEIVQLMIQAARQTIQCTAGPTLDGEEFVPVYLGDHSKLRALGWQPTHTLDGAIQELMRSQQRQAVAQPV